MMKSNPRRSDLNSKTQTSTKAQGVDRRFSSIAIDCEETPIRDKCKVWPQNLGKSKSSENLHLKFNRSADRIIVVRPQKNSYTTAVTFVRSAEEQCAAALRNARTAEREKCGRRFPFLSG